MIVTDVSESLVVMVNAADSVAGAARVRPMLSLPAFVDHPRTVDERATDIQSNFHEPREGF
jgi:hypothetical protein